LGAGSAAVDRVPRRRAHCPRADQRGVRRPQGRACDIGAYELARPTITISSPLPRGSYRLGARVLAHFHCDEGGIASAIATCRGSVRGGRAVSTGRVGTERLEVIAVDKSGSRVSKTVRY